MFVEYDRQAFKLLQQLLRERFPAVETEAYNGEFEGHIPEACRFATAGAQPFAFVFIDPTGWTVEAYCARVLQAGDFAHCVATVILNPRHDRTHHHLVYATRSVHGLIAFRDTERKATPEQSEARAEAKRRERVARDSQTELFAAPVLETSYMSQLQLRYQQKARAAVADKLRDCEEVEFDTLVATALQQPMTSLADLKEWLNEWRQAGKVEFLGLAVAERALAVNKKHRLRRRGELPPDPAPVTPRPDPLPVD